MLDKHARWVLAGPIHFIAVRLNSYGITPNTITLIGFVLTILSAIIIATGYFFVGGLVLGVAALFDMLDGVLARLSKPSKFGAFLDSTLDRYSESFSFLGLVYYYLTFANARNELSLIFFILIGSLMVSYTRARAEALNIECKVGLLQRPERLVILIVGLLSYWVFPIVLTVALWILAIFTNVTALQRIYDVYWKAAQSQVTLPPQEKS